jgi:RNA polymerase sigma factor (sigma-70 family)
MMSARTRGALGGQLDTLYRLGSVGAVTDGQLLERFLTRDDPAASEAAFAALVDRHGAMVWGVCRRVLGDPHDAHDAFQATFLVLVSKAGTVRSRESVAGWLFGIARRVAARARVEAARRRRHLARLGAEQAAARASREDLTAPEPEPDTGPLLAELDRLPERFRAPVILHYFEGLSTEATAQRLGCARGTVLSRLARARDRLRRRLEPLGVAPAALLPPVEAGIPWLAPEAVPPALVQATLRSAGSLAMAGAVIESIAPATVATLSRGVARAVTLTQVRAAAGLILLAVASVSLGFAAAFHPADKPAQPGQENPSRVASRKSEPPRAEEKGQEGRIAFRGQVLDPEGKPVAGAAILLVPGPGALEPDVPRPPQRLAASGPDGRFEVMVPRASLEGPGGGRPGPFSGAGLAALAPGLGPDWGALDTGKSAEPITLRLRRDDVPIEGRIIGLEGRPVPGLTVSVAYIAEFPPELIRKLRENAGNMNGLLWSEMRNALMIGKGGPLPEVRTGADGRFRITGVGRDRAVLLLVEGASIEQSFAMVFTASDPGYKPVLLPADNSGERRLEGPRFALTVAPGRLIEGVVRDAQTRRPIPGATVRSWWVLTTATTDAQGRFRIAGQPKGKENILEVVVDGQPYIKVSKPVADASGLGPVAADFLLRRGVWIRGRVTNRATGRPVKAVVQYYPLRDNPHAKECPDASFWNNHLGDEAEFPTDADGRFRAVALPGGGLLTVRTGEPGYLTAEPLEPKVAGNVLHAVNFEYQMKQYQALVPIDPRDGEDPVIPDIALAPGRPRRLQAVGPDGRPVARARLFSYQSSFAGEPMPGGEFTFFPRKPGTAEPVLIVQDDQAMGRFLAVEGDETDPIRVTLEPTATIAGRLVDEGGRPRPDMHLAVTHALEARGERIRCERLADPTMTGPDGRFRIKGLVAGVTYTVEVIKKRFEMNYSERAEGYLHKAHWTVKPGEVLDWGDVQVQAYRR